MAFFTSQWRVIGATAFSVALIVGAFVAAKDFFVTPVVQASTETALLQSIASKDSDADGLPDWEESLYGTDPQKADTKNLGMTDGEAVAKGLVVPKAPTDVPIAASTENGTTTAADPHVALAAKEGTLTDVFAKSFFTLYLNKKASAGGAELTKEQLSQIVDQALTQLTSAIQPAPDFKTKNDIVVAGSGAEAFRTYAIAAEGVFAAHTAHLPKGELDYLSEAQKGDDAAIPHLVELSDSYHDIAVGLAALTVPKEAAAVHLEIVNAAARVSAINRDFAKLKTDPLLTMLALKQAPAAVKALAQGFIDLEAVSRSMNLTFVPGTPGASFVNVMANIRARSARTTP